ncbi:MAG: efflux RND transporter permease subunit [Candidatus Ancaeobacter aquaticus]|nr:efflux RND transporter permease subunit [Candidatus Ancaeobacter aquaticus]
MADSDYKTSHKGPLAWMAGNTVAANLLMLVFIIGGLLYSTRIKQEVFPSFELDMVSISVPYPGASPEEIEKGVIFSVEEAVRGLDGVKEVTSKSQEGVGTVRVEILLGENNQKILQDIKQEVDRITSFPEETEEPQITLLTMRRQVLQLVLYGDTDEITLRKLAEKVRDELIQSKDITQVELGAVRPLEISIEVPQSNLRAYNLTLDEIARKVKQTSVELPGGGIKTNSGEILLRMKERRDYGKEFSRIPIVTSAEGTEVLLDDIATIVDGFEDIDKYALYNGKSSVLVNVYRVGKQTPIQVSDAVKKFVSENVHLIPPGIGIAVQNDSSDIYRQRLNLLIRNGRIGLIVVFIILALFLEARLAFWVTIGIPISFLGSLLFLPVFGVSINMISLFAFIIALGIVVDDAIVVGENIYKYHQDGVPFLESAIKGVREVVMPVTFSILTNIAAFMPLFFIPGVTGKIFRTIPAVVVVVFLISLVESLLILPSHLGHQKTKRGRFGAWVHGYQKQFSDGFSHFIKTVFGPFLEKVIHKRYVTIAIAVSILIITISFMTSGRLGMTLFPRVESDLAVAGIVMPFGCSVEETESVQKKLITALNEVVAENGGEELVSGIFSEIGAATSLSSMRERQRSGAHLSQIIAYLTPPDVRPIGTAKLVKLWRERVGEIPGVESLTFQSDAGGPGSGSSLKIELSHSDIKVLEKASSELADALSYFPKVKDIDDGFSPGKQQLDFHLLPEARSLGLNTLDVARQIRNAFYGSEALRQQRGRNEIKVMVRLPKSERISEYNWEELLISTPSGIEIPILEAIDFNRGRSYTSIERREGRRIVNVRADVEPNSHSGKVIAALKKNTLPELTRKYPGLNYSFEGKQADIAENLGSLKIGFLFAMILVYGLLAIPFRSYIQPAIVMVSIPFGIIGAVIGHLIMGYSLSILSMFGIVALSGVVVNDSLLLINFANNARAEGKTAFEAIVLAGTRRFRPIILTTITTFGGLAPMIFETSMQARFLIPMAISLGYGILFATGITLLLVPSLYMTIEDVKKAFGLRMTHHEDHN